jgi:DNA-binding Xre family transcriptional regulator
MYLYYGLCENKSRIFFATTLIRTGKGTNWRHELAIINREVEVLKLNRAISRRIVQLLEERHMTQYELFMKSGIPKSTIGNVINCTYDSVKLRIIHEMCQGFGIGLEEFFRSPLFDEDNLEP